MKVLLAFDRGLDWYLDAHVAGVEAAGFPVDVGLGRFWQVDPFEYGVVHVQWPETLFNWRSPCATEMESLCRRLTEIRPHAKIIYTRHNDESHNANVGTAPTLRKLYALIESECDVMVHLGEASKTACEMRPELREKKHVVIPIPVYDEIYAPDLDMDRSEALQKLGIPLNRKVVLAFGHFRHEEERRLVANAFRSLAVRNVMLVAPGWNKPVSRLRPLSMMCVGCKTLLARTREMRLGTKSLLPHEAVARHFVAADVVFIQRRDDLNSANLPMAFLFKKVVVGPDHGNIGYWLRKTGNPVFNPEDPGSVCSALRQALELASSGLGDANHRFALSHWTTRQMGEAYVRLYQEAGEAASREAAGRAVLQASDGGRPDGRHEDGTREGVAAPTGSELQE